MTTDTPGTIDRPSHGLQGRQAASASRMLTPLLFAAALLALALPFGTVSCGTPVTFTGFELATASVHGDDSELAAEINQGAGPVFAAGVVLVSVAGLLLALFGSGGQGWAAGSGLLFLALLPWVALIALADSVEGRAGYFLAFVSLAAVTGARVHAVLGQRRREGRRIWALVTLLCLFGLFLAFSALLALPETA